MAMDGWTMHAADRAACSDPNSSPDRHYSNVPAHCRELVTISNTANQSFHFVSLRSGIFARTGASSIAKSHASFAVGSFNATRKMTSL